VGSVIILISSRNPTASPLYRVIKKVVPEEQLELTTDLESLTKKLRKPGQHDIIVVIMAGRREDLDLLFSIRSSFNDLRIILILPDGDQETIAKGHSLRPRFLSFADGDFTDVAAVLHKMLMSNSKKREVEA